MIRTIIVDDEILAGVGIQSLIDGTEEIKVGGVFSGPEEALDYLRENTVDIVITDIEMADMNGLEFIQMIREQHLAEGVIILSCHEDFAYAQEAISKGTDSYLLKHSISREKLVSEIKKVYEKTHRAQTLGAGQSRPQRPQRLITGKELYVIGVVRLRTVDGTHVDGSMLVHLLEGVASRYDMGTVFAPYNREIFIIFQFQQDTPPLERNAALKVNLETIRNNLQQYLDDRIIYGISRDFTDLKQTREKYDEAVRALEMRFYEPGKTVFFYREPATEVASPAISGARFWETDGLERFEQELSDYLQSAFLRQMPARTLKSQLGQSISRMIYQVLQEHRFSEALIQKWNSDAALLSVLHQADDVGQLRQRLTEIMEQLQKECLSALNDDALSGVLDYIEQNLSKKLSLAELAELACMSVPSFSKKFKERTGLTLVQYLNVQRIERAKLLLKDRSYTLEQIAEETGFSNANYLIRVFKKVTGQTISEYRK